jgi:putative component of membrane protein insertase Oxa1/YidC/SpoIIIJ protein YidD
MKANLIIIISLAMTCSVFGGQNVDSLETIPEDDEKTISVKSVLLFPIDFYQNYLGKIKGSYCPMYPSCSNYGSIAVKKFGLKGVIMTFDRLHRCGHDLNHYPPIIVGDQIHFLDPVK